MRACLSLWLDRVRGPGCAPRAHAPGCARCQGQDHASLRRQRTYTTPPQHGFPCRSEHITIAPCSRRACPHTVFYILSAGLKLQGKIGPKTKLSDVVTVREPKEEVPDVPAPEVNLAAFPPAPSMPAYSM